MVACSCSANCVFSASLAARAASPLPVPRRPRVRRLVCRGGPCAALLRELGLGGLCTACCASWASSAALAALLRELRPSAALALRCSASCASRAIHAALLRELGLEQAHTRLQLRHRRRRRCLRRPLEAPDLCRPSGASGVVREESCARSRLRADTLHVASQLAYEPRLGLARAAARSPAPPGSLELVLALAQRDEQRGDRRPRANAKRPDACRRRRPPPPPVLAATRPLRPAAPAGVPPAARASRCSLAAGARARPRERRLPLPVVSRLGEARHSRGRAPPSPLKPPATCLHRCAPRRASCAAAAPAAPRRRKRREHARRSAVKYRGRRGDASTAARALRSARSRW